MQSKLQQCAHDSQRCFQCTELVSIRRSAALKSKVRSFWHLRLVYPDGNFYRKWSLMMAFPMVYTAIVTPLYIGLLDGPPRPIFVIDRVMDVIFISDMVRQRYVNTFALR